MFRSADRSFARSCSLRPANDDTKSGDLQLSSIRRSWTSVPSMNFVSGTPTYYGPPPSTFRLRASRSTTTKSFTSECFSIGADTGMVSISNTDDLDPGTYKLTIACRPAARLPLREYLRGADGFRHARGDRGERADARDSLCRTGDHRASVTVAPVGESVSILNYSLVQAEGFRILYHLQRRRCDI